MSVSAAVISTRIDNILQGFGYPVEKRDADGEQVLDPTEAVRFAVQDRDILVRYDQANDSILLSTGVNEDDEQLRVMLKNLARDTMKNFDYKRFGKKLRPKSERVDIAQHRNQSLSDLSEEQDMEQPTETPVSENNILQPITTLDVDGKEYKWYSDTEYEEDRTWTEDWLVDSEGNKYWLDAWKDGEANPEELELWIKMGMPSREELGLNRKIMKGDVLSAYKEGLGQSRSQEKIGESFGAMTGSTRTSYQPLDNVKIVVKHRKPVNEESRGARSRNIHSIYIQRGEERFRMAENNLRAARAMARHINMGGEMHDSVGTAIVEMAGEERKLREFVKYVKNRKLMNEDNEHYVTLASESVQNIRSTFDKLSGVRSYANAVDSLQDMASVEILEDDVDLENKFVEKHFDDRVANAMDSIRRSMSRQRAYESAIEKAIQSESFDGFKNFLRETDLADFESPQARLSYQVSQLGSAAQNPMLKNHLQGISQRLSSGQTLNDSDYRTVKSCLLSAREAKVQESQITESAEQQYANFLEQFDIDP